MKDKYQIVKSRYEHILCLYNNLRKTDYDELFLLTGKDPNEIMLRSWETSVLSWTIMCNNNPIAIFGAAADLNDKSIGKIAHNMKFEDTWANVYWGTKVNGWQWDTMLATHLLDNRKYICSLKFQVYVNFGVVDYDSEISGYLESGSKNANSVNKVSELITTEEGYRKLMSYCGMDVIFTYRLAMAQQRRIKVG